MHETIKLPKFYTDVLNQVFEIEKKTQYLQENNTILRNINRIKEAFESIPATILGETASLKYKDPLGEKFNETRTDCDANIAGTSTENLVITEVIKPIIYIQFGSISHLVQKGVVIVETAITK